MNFARFRGSRLDETDGNQHASKLVFSTLKTNKSFEINEKWKPEKFSARNAIDFVLKQEQSDDEGQGVESTY